MKRNKSYYSEEHGYVCDCRPSVEPYEMLCDLCQQYLEQEDMDDETMESTDERGEREEE